MRLNYKLPRQRQETRSAFGRDPCLSSDGRRVMPVSARRAPNAPNSGRGGRVVEGARLERVYTGNRIEGSNPSPSAISPFVTFAACSIDADGEPIRHAI